MEHNNRFNEESKIVENHKYKFTNKETLSSKVTWKMSTKYIDLGEFKTFFQGYVPQKISESKADSIVFTILISYAALNSSKITVETLTKLANTCNNRIVGKKLDDETLTKIIRKALAGRFEFKPKDNSAVRYIKNPLHVFDVAEMKRETVRLRKIADYKLMLELVKVWDFEKDGSPTQENLGLKLGYSRRTMIRKFKDTEGLVEFFEVWEELKQCYKTGFSQNSVKPTTVKLNLKKSNVKNKKTRVKKIIKKEILNVKPTEVFYTNEPPKPISLKQGFDSFFGKINRCQLV